MCIVIFLEQFSFIQYAGDNLIKCQALSSEEEKKNYDTFSRDKD